MKAGIAKIIGVPALLALFSTFNASAQGTAFSYQGQLQSSGSPAGGTYSLTFALFTTNTGGNPVAGPVTNSAVNISNGLFTAIIDFGSSVWEGATNWLEIGVATNGASSFTTLSPRQQLTPVPYAITAENLDGTVAAAGLSGTYGNQLTLNNAANQFSGNFSGNGAGLANVNAATLGGLSAANFWKTSGNSGTSPNNGNFAGTTDNEPFELKVDSVRAMLFEPNSSGWPNVIGGAPANAVASFVTAATIGGGNGNTIQEQGYFANIGGGGSNTVNTSFATIGGGLGNTIQINSGGSAIGGGIFNTIQTTGLGASVIAGGFTNTIQSNTVYSAIGGGYQNTIQTDAQESTIAGGAANTIETNAQFAAVGGGTVNLASGDYATVGGGEENTAADGSTVGGGIENTASGYGTTVGGGYNNLAAILATVGGGYGNTASGTGAVVGGGGYDGLSYAGGTASGNASVVGGGWNNEASGDYATIPGGYNNLASGYYSFAAGADAQATDDGCFVWADNSGGTFSSTVVNQFAVRATGGVQLLTGSGTGLTMNGPEVTFSNNTTTFVTGAGSLAIVDDNGYTPGITVSGSLYSGHMRFRNALEIWPNNAGASGGYFDVRNTEGIQTIWMSGTNGNITCTSLTQTSDRNAKQDFAPISPAQILDKVLELPVSEWSYKEDAGPRHIGPMAQDFYSIFNIGTDDKHIAPIDEGGVAFAAIQGLNQKLEEQVNEKDAEILKLKEKAGKVDTLEKRLTELEQVVRSLTEKN
jgi:hypothetical protein